MSVDPLSLNTAAGGQAGAAAPHAPALARADAAARAPAVSLSDFVGPEVALSLAVADIAVERLREKVDAVKVAGALSRQADRDYSKRLLEQMEAAAKAEKSGLLAKIFGWIAKILTLVTAAVAVAATGGAASPVMAAALLLATYDLAASAAMEAKSGLQIGLADGLGKFVGLLAKACGANEAEIKQAEQWGGLALAMVIQLGVAGAALAPNAAAKAFDKAGELLSGLGAFFARLGTRSGRLVGESLQSLAASPTLPATLNRLGAQAAERAPLLGNLPELSAATTRAAAPASAAAAGGASRAGAGAADLTEDAWADASKWMKVALKLQGPVGAFQGANAITEGALGIKSGVEHYRAALAEAQALESVALLNYLNAFFEKQKQEMEVASRDLGAVLKQVGDMIELEADTQSSIASNFGPMRAA